MNNQFGVFNDVPGIDVEFGHLPQVWQSSGYMYAHQDPYDVVHHPGLDTKTPYHAHHGLPLKSPYSGETVFTPTYDHTYGYSHFAKPGLPTPIDTPTPFSYDDNETDSTTSRSPRCSVTHPEDLATREHKFAHAHADDTMQWNIGHCSTTLDSSSSPATPTADFVALNEVYPEDELEKPMLVEHCNGGETVIAFPAAVPHPYTWTEPESPPESQSSAASVDDEDEEEDEDEDFLSDTIEETADDDDDPSYNPSRSTKPRKKAAPKAPRSRRQAAQRRTLSDVPTTRTSSDRGFPCPFAPYGCEGKFGSKNEWKRHVATQHVKLAFWRCDLCPQSNSGPNDFNRKDLFTQHLKRMHRKHLVDEYDPKKKDQYRDIERIPDKELSEATEPLVKQCFLQLRQAPNKCRCLFCETNFKGAGAWERRMEHLAIHLERFRKAGNKLPPVHEWRHDEELEMLLEQEGLIERDTKGKWQIGDGTPIRSEKKIKSSR
jgi:hypothetical protein